MSKESASRKFIIHVVLFVAMFIATIGILNFLIDPFNLNRIFNLGLPKDRVSSIMHYRLYEMSEFRHSPKSVILLGDSRSHMLNVEYFHELGYDDIANLAYGGGTLYEEIDTFWFAIRQIKLSKVIMGVPFNLFNENNTLNQVKEAENFLKNPFGYYFSFFILRASLRNLYTRSTGKMQRTERPSSSRDAFWKYQLGPSTTGRYYSMFIYPKELIVKLKQVVDYCRQNNIVLQFYIPPSHIDLQNKVYEYGLREYYNRYKKELAKYGEVIDFDYPNEITSERDNFKDPYHPKANICRKIVEELVSGTSTFCRRYGG